MLICKSKNKLLNAVHGVLLGSMASTCFAVPANTASYNGTTVGTSTWARPFASGSCCSGLGPVTYTTQNFYVDSDGAYDFSSLQNSYDGYLFLYQDAFDPLNQTLNFVAGDDDGSGGIGTSDFSANLTANTQYIIIDTGFAAGDEGTFTTTITGPGVIYLATLPVAALTPNANSLSLGAATTLDNLRGNAGPEMAAVIAALDALSPQAQGAALARISPQTNDANEIAVNDFNRSVLESISNRLRRAQTERGMALGLAQQQLDSRLLLADTNAYSGAGLGKLAGSDQYGLWLQAFGSKTKQDQHASHSGFDANTSGFTIGADTLLSSEWVVGGAFSYGRTDVNQEDFRDGDSSEIDTYQLTSYASRDFGNWYVNGMLGYSQQKYDTKRNISTIDIAKGDFDGEQFLAKIEAGYPITLGHQLILTPLAGLEWNHLELESYQEKGASPLNLKVTGEDSERTASNIGARLEMAIDLEHGARLYPSTHARWVHQFNNDGVDTTAAFVGGGTSFVTPGKQLAQDSYIVGVGLTLQQANGSSVSLQLDSEQATARSGYAGQLEAQWLF
jgi:outer membrane autotransporter protein